MTRTTFTIAVAFLCSTALAAPQPPVTFESTCECQGNHGEHRWSVKVDPSLPPADASVIQSVTPSDVCVVEHDQLIGDIDKPKWSGEAGQQVQQPSQSCLPLGLIHVRHRPNEK